MERNEILLVEYTQVHAMDWGSGETFAVAFTVGTHHFRCGAELQWTVIMDTCIAVGN